MTFPLGEPSRPDVEGNRPFASQTVSSPTDQYLRESHRTSFHDRSPFIMPQEAESAPNAASPGKLQANSPEEIALGEGISSRRASEPPDHDYKGLPARREALIKHMLRALGKWLMSLLLTGCTYAVLIDYSNKSVLSNGQKRVFNALITGLLIAQALTSVSIMNHVVGNLRWWILSRRPRSVSKIEAILRARSLTNVVVTSFGSKRASFHTAAFSWLFTAVGVQVALASINLCYSVENNEDIARLVAGRVALPDLTTIPTASVVKSSSSLGAQQYTANRLGIISWAFDTASTDEIPVPRTLWYSDDPLFFCSPDSPSCTYVFRDVNEATQGDPNRIFVSALTDRTVNSTTVCLSYPVTSGGDGTQSNITVQLPESETETIRLPVRGGMNQTTFFTNTTTDCGPGCSMIHAFEAAEPSSWYYNCNTTIREATHVSLPAHEVGLSLRNLSGSAIALQGFAAVSNDGPADFNQATDLTIQSMVYPSESVFGTAVGGESETMAYLLSRFSIGVLGVAAMSDTTIVVDGQAPVLGVRLHIVHWGLINFILIAVCGGLFLLGVVGTWFANKVVAPGDSLLAEAQVLKTIEAAREEQRVAEERAEEGAAVARVRSRWYYRDEYVGTGQFDLHMACTTPEPPQGMGKGR